MVSERNTFAVNHHHPLRTLSAFGRPDRGAPFFAGAKLPSANVSAQTNWPFSSNSARKDRQIVTHTSCCSQSRRRRVPKDSALWYREVIKSNGAILL